MPYETLLHLQTNKNIPRETHSSGFLQSYSVSSNMSSGRNDGKVGDWDLPFSPPLIKERAVESATGIRADDEMLRSFKRPLISCLTYSRLRLQRNYYIIIKVH